MINKKLIVFVVLLIFLMFISNNNFVFAQDGSDLGVKYPEILGSAPETTTTPVPEYINYIFNFLMFISGFIALGVLIMAGYQYFLSAGSPEKMSDAKDKIKAALLGLLILFGSYLILYNINPDLISFDLPRLSPIVSELAPGVLVCREPTAEEIRAGGEKPNILEAWSLQATFRSAEDYGAQKIASRQLEELFKNISKYCYPILTGGTIRSDLDNKITDIYFIPGTQKIDDKEYISIYGAILYEDASFRGKSLPIYKHFRASGPVVLPEHITIESGFKPSSIRPFLLIPQHYSEEWQVTLFQEYNQNMGTDLTGRAYSLIPGTWYYERKEIKSSFGLQVGTECKEDFCVVRSLWVKGPFLAILTTPDGRSEAFANVIDNNLDDNHNITTWVKCKEYDSDERREEIDYRGDSMVTTGYSCAQPQIKGLIVISGRLY